MRLGPKFALSLALVSALAVPSLQPAAWSAAETATTPAATLTPTVTTPGAALRDIGLPAPPHGSADVEEKIDNRVSQIQFLINREKASGRLSNEQADNFLSAVNQIAESEAEFIALAGKLEPHTDLLLQLQLDALEQNIFSSMHDRKLATLDLVGRETFLQHMLARLENDGRLTKADADDGRARLKSILASQSNHAAGGKLGYGDVLAFSLQLDHLSSWILKHIQPRPYASPDLPAMVAQLEEAQAKESATGLENIRLLSMQLNHPLPPVSSLKNVKAAGLAAVRLAADLEWVKALLDEDLTGKWVALDPKTETYRLDRRIADALDQGHLTPPEAQQLRSDLDAIITQDQSFTTGGNALGSQQKAQLALALARLSGRIDRTSHAPTRFWAGIDAFQTSLDSRIGEAVKAGRLTADQAAQLRAAADAVAATEETYRKGTTGMDSKQALALALQLEQLNVKLHQTLKDRVTKAPDIDALQAALDKAVADTVDMGRVDYRSPVVDKLNHVTDLKNAYAAAPGGLDDRAKLAVATEIMHHIAELKGAAHNDVSTAPTTLDMRLSQLTQDINNAAASGVLSVDRAGQYKAALETIYNSMIAGRKTTMTAAQTLAVANDLDSLRDQFDDEMRGAATLPIQLAPRIRDVAAHIGRALADGRLPLSEANQLITSLDRTAERLASAASTQGGLSHGEGLRLAFEIESISERTEASMLDQPILPAQVHQRANDTDSKLANALASGKLTADQAQIIRNQMQGVLQDENVFLSTDAALSYPEQLALGLEWDEVSHTIDQNSVQTRLKDISTRRNQLEQRVRDAVAAGKIPAKDAQQLIGDLDRFEQTEANFRVSDERLDLAEALTLSLEIDRLSARVDGLLRGPISLKKH